MTQAFPPAVLSKHTAVVGMTGSGKTSTEKLLIEQVAGAGSRVCILDPIKSDWWGITSSKSGNGPGLPFQILGGPHGHIPLHAGAGAAIAEVVADGKLPLSIIDMADFGPGGLQRFFNDFAPVLVKKMRGVLYLVIEEAHEFCPKEKSGVTGENMSVYYAKKLATAGRSKGVRLVVATQRLQALHNAVLSSCETVVVHRMTYPADQEPVTKWLHGHVKDKEIRTQIEDSMPELADGEGWICSGSAKILQRVQFPRIHTFDNSATPDDDDTSRSVVTAKVDHQKLRSLIGKAVEEAEANDPAKLKSQIAELERQLRSKDGGASREDIEAARRKGMEQGLAAAMAPVNAKLISIVQTSDDLTFRIRELHDSICDSMSHQRPGAPPENPEPQRRQMPARQDAVIPATRSRRQIDGGAPGPSNGGGSGDLPKGEAAILRALIQFPDGLRREQITVLTTFARSTRDRYLQYLKAKGLIDQSGETVTATDAGRAALPNAEPLPTGAALRDHWLRELPSGEKRILEVLIEHFPKAVDREALSQETGFARSTRDRYLQYMANKQIVDATRGEVRAAKDLF